LENPKVLVVQAYIHVLRTKRDKKIVKGTLVGIYERIKGYRCYILEWKKVVTFNLSCNM
jgi:hypothetical protein